MKLTIALDRYDRHMPLFLGLVPPPDGIEWEVLEVGMVPPRRQGIDRHRRMLIDREFDVAEVSLGSYLLAKQRGLRMTAVPVFPRRLFSQNHIFVNAKAGIRAPQDLVGKRVGVWAFQVTMSVLAKGDLKSCYDVPWQRINWVAEHPEEVPFSYEKLPISRAAPGKDISQMLVDGEIDALVYPHPSYIVQESGDRVRRLFPDVPAECRTYYRQQGHYPIMHLLAVKEEAVQQCPDLPRHLIAAWEQSKMISHDFYHDPGFAMLAFARNELERQESEMGRDLWPSGLAANRANLVRFMDYMVDQRLLPAPLAMEAIFHSSVLDT
ncbi:MAG TPA: ABC transporter substrate-binding protein [Stellaceae bacterium]|nr:ABC transporter substrate-binding protein [Stellaceae bacterium]